MGINKKNSFDEKLDNLFLLSGEVIKNKGEDNYYCAYNEDSAIVSVFDGCGGLGARTYESFEKNTGAYMASRAVSGAIHDWYHNTYGRIWNDKKQLLSSVKSYINGAFSIVSRYGESNFKISGSMVRDFPTTAAIALVQNHNDGLILHVIWAGDSRIYLMDYDGLAQLTSDDVDGEDAMSNLSNDGVLTNVLSSDGNYELHYRRMHIRKPSVVFAATDGCFGYIPTPMEFEYIILRNLLGASTPEEFRRNLSKNIKDYAGDDYTLGMMGFLYGDFRNMQTAFRDRKMYLEKEYILSLEKDRSDELTDRLWMDYQKSYERYL